LPCFGFGARIGVAVVPGPKRGSVALLVFLDAHVRVSEQNLLYLASVFDVHNRPAVLRQQMKAPVRRAIGLLVPNGIFSRGTARFVEGNILSPVFCHVHAI
jgi:hypothetical protein